MFLDSLYKLFAPSIFLHIIRIALHSDIHIKRGTYAFPYNDYIASLDRSRNMALLCSRKIYIYYPTIIHRSLS